MTITIPDTLITVLRDGLILYVAYAVGWFGRQRTAQPEKMRCPKCKGSGEHGIDINMGPMGCDACEVKGWVWRIHTPIKPPADYSPHDPHWPPKSP